MTTNTSALALISLAALAALLICAITFLAAIGANIPVELTAALWGLVSAAGGGGLVKGAALIDERRADSIRKQWAGIRRDLQ